MNTRRRLMAMNLMLVAGAMVLVLVTVATNLSGERGPIQVADPVFEAFVATYAEPTAVALEEPQAAPQTAPQVDPGEVPQVAHSAGDAPVGS